MTPNEFNDFTYEISAMMILFVIFYTILSFMGAIRLINFLNLRKKHNIGLLFYGILEILCLFRTGIFIYGAINVFQKKDIKKFYTKAQSDVFLAFFPDSLFWAGMCCYFWLVFSMFYASHINENDFFALSNDSSRIRINKSNWKWFIFFIASYGLLEFIVLPIIYFFEKIDCIDYASIQGSFAMGFPFIIAYFVYRMYRKFSGTFYISNDFKKISREHFKQTGLILSLRFILGLIDLSLFHTSLKNLFTFDDELTDVDYNTLTIEAALVVISLFLLETLPIFISLRKNSISICEKYSYEELLLSKKSENIIQKENKDLSLLQENNKNNEVFYDRIENNNEISNKDKLSLPGKFSCNLKKIEYKKINFFEYINEKDHKNSFGSIRLATLSRRENDGLPELCIRTIELSTNNRFLLEDIERDMNKHVFLQAKLQNKIVNLEGYSLFDQNICLIYENMKNGSLKKFFETSQKDALKFDFRVKILLEIAICLNDLHKINIIHGHLTPNNIFFDSEFNIRIGDLLFYDLKKYSGFSKGYSNKSKYTAPEYIKDNGFISINPKSTADIYSFGLICWEILTGEIPFKGVNKTDLKKILIEENFRPKIPNIIPDELAKLIRCCWQDEEKNRPNCSQIIGVLEGLLELKKK